MVTRIGSTRVTHPIGASRDLPGMVGGKTFKTLDAFEKKIGKSGTAILPPGQHVRIFVGKINMGGPHASLVGLNKDSAFTSKFDNSTGYITITAKAGAKMGSKDSVKIDHGSPVVLHPPPSTKFPFKLLVGIGHIMMG